jgi:hypothetical protein
VTKCNCFHRKRSYPGPSSTRKLLRFRTKGNCSALGQCWSGPVSTHSSISRAQCIAMEASMPGFSFFCEAVDETLQPSEATSFREYVRFLVSLLVTTALANNSYLRHLRDSRHLHNQPYPVLSFLRSLDSADWPNPREYLSSPLTTPAPRFPAAPCQALSTFTEPYVDSICIFAIAADWQSLCFFFNQTPSNGRHSRKDALMESRRNTRCRTPGPHQHLICTSAIRAQ